ncbi:MAG: DNA methyltransferase [candidate division SR1 bacterium]|nr:DNA methyltransferase [candidate division SR1 bacterium]
MYFAVLGKNPEISMLELELVKAKEISYPKKGIVIFDTKYPELLPQLGGTIKIGTVVKEKDLQELLTDVKIIGIQNEANGKHLKRTVGIRRYKLVDVFHTDKEIKNKGKEIINLENGLYGIVEQYQNIELYEAVDFGKPGRSMEMGMMPAKLAHMMINIGLAKFIHESQLDSEKICIYDPFVGSGTTGMLANYMGYDFVGSDIKINYAEKNATWRKTSNFYTPDREFEIFKHDIKEKLGNQLAGKDVLVVTEGRLGPIVKKGTSDQDIQKFQERVVDLYKSFLDRIKELGAVAVFTIPRYVGQENGIEQVLTKYATNIGIKIQSIPEIYGREGQQVGRKIMTIS